MSKKVKIGKRGIITLPAELRKKYGLREEDDLIVEETAEGLLLRPTVTMPVEIYIQHMRANLLVFKDPFSSIPKRNDMNTVRTNGDFLSQFLDLIIR